MFDDLGYFHPIVVHFSIALTFVGVGARRLLWVVLKRDSARTVLTAVSADVPHVKSPQGQARLAALGQVIH